MKRTILNNKKFDGGFCRDCPKVRERKDIIYCDSCSEKHKKHSTKFRQQIKKLGLCRCGQQPLFNRYNCEVCWFKDVTKRNLGSDTLWKELRQKLIHQNYICPYTGRILSIGKNASLDHILPRSRKGTETLDNVQWVDLAVNRAKSNMTPEEFLVFISEMYHYHFKQ